MVPIIGANFEVGGHHSSRQRSSWLGRSQELEFSSLRWHYGSSRSRRYEHLDLALNRRQESEMRLSPYSSLECESHTSATLKIWNRTIEWRRENKGDLVKKFTAEVLFLGGGLTGLVEIPLAAIAAYVVGNPVSALLAKAINFIKDDKNETIQSYNRVKKALNKNVDEAVQGLAQNITSFSTNLVSHNLNIRVSKHVREVMKGKAETSIAVIEHISPISVAIAVIKKDPSGVAYDMKNGIAKENGWPDPFDPRPLTFFTRNLERHGSLLGAY